MPLTPSERMKYLAELKAKKAADDGAVIEIGNSPKRKKGRTGRSDAKRPPLSGGVAGEKVKISTSVALNEKVMESFWDRDFDFRRYDIPLMLSSRHSFVIALGRCEKLSYISYAYCVKFWEFTS